MSRQTRTLLVLLVLGLCGTVVLALMAHRYLRLLGPPGGGGGAVAAAALADVDAFIEVRRTVREALDARARATDSDLARVQAARDRALARSALDAAAYARVRSAYRAWRAGRVDAGAALGAALEQRRAALEAVALGDYEGLDS
jgi:hypothetical protein